MNLNTTSRMALFKTVCYNLKLAFCLRISSVCIRVPFEIDDFIFKVFDYSICDVYVVC